MRPCSRTRKCQLARGHQPPRPPWLRQGHRRCPGSRGRALARDKSSASCVAPFRGEHRESLRLCNLAPPAQPTFGFAFMRIIRTMAVFIANLGFMTMQILTSREVQKNFGAISDKVVREGETMTITKYGRPSLYILPANEETATLVRRMAGRRLIQKMKSRAPNAEAENLTQADINQLIDECFR